jgi:hypothetical protein
MKKILTALILVATTQIVLAQQIKNFKVSNDGNVIERTIILDLLRAELQKEFKQEFVFTINVFNVSNKYAWIKASAARKDGKKIVFKKDEENFMDCCHVEALMIKKSTGWAVAEHGAFSTDVWYDGIWKRHNAPIAVWGSDYHKD